GGSFTIASGASTVGLYYRDTKAGTPSITLSNASSLTDPTAQVEAVSAGSASQLVFLTAARTYTAGVCGGAGEVITVQLQDPNGNAVNAGVGGQAFTAASTSTGAAFYTDAACGTVARGGSFT